MKAEVEEKVDFSIIRYAQCWEDAGILLEALDIQANDVCVGIGSAGDNCFAKLTKNPKRVIAIDLNSSQIACIELRASAYRNLSYEEFLILMGSRNGDNRIKLYELCRGDLSPTIKEFWDNRRHLIEKGIGGLGKFENYFRLFREKLMPWVHSRKKISALLEPKSQKEVEEFYDKKWDTIRWRFLFKIFFSRFVMGRLGRDPKFFSYVKGSVGDKILERTRHALRNLPPHENPYLYWILNGTHGTALPLALREDSFHLIRKNLNQMEWHLGSIEQIFSKQGITVVNKFNLSDIFEYMSSDVMENLYELLLNASVKGTRFAYWNMLAPRSVPLKFKNRILSHESLGKNLLLKDKAFFYSAFIVEEVL